MKALALAALLPLAACRTSGTATNTLDTICHQAPLAHFAFLTVAALGNLPPNIVRTEADIYFIIDAACFGKIANPTEALVRALGAWAQLQALHAETLP